MKRSTLLLLAIAALGGLLVYYLEYKPGKPRDEKPDTTKPAFSFTREEVAGINLTRAGKTVNLENQNNKWVITSPINAAADEAAINSLIGDVVSARIERELTATPDDLKNFGLAEPAVKLELKLKNGQTRRVELGAKDVTGSSAYAKVDGGQSVAIVPVSMLTSSDKSVDDLRDRSVLGATQLELTSVKINNGAGGLELAKQDADWKLKGPISGDVDETAVNTLLTDLASAKATEVVSETPDEPAKYGLDKSKLGFSAKLSTGGERSVQIGSKVDDKYYAKTSDRPQIYKVDQALIDKLNTKPASLRSKDVVRINPDELKSVSIKNPNGTLAAENRDGKWVVTEPADKKDKEALAAKVFNPFESKATEVLDPAPPAILAKLAKPEVEVKLTEKNGKTTVIRVSAADGESCYVRVEGRNEIYKMSKFTLESLSFKLEEALGQ
jgi:hypothetical protein